MTGRAAAALAALGERERRRLLEGLTQAERRALDEDWPSWLHAGQQPPDGDWRVWVLLAGRGFGKTRAGAEWVSQYARDNPGAAIALVAATAEEARAVMIEGRSGLLRIARAAERGAMTWEPSRRRLAFASGAEAFVYSAANPESLRGPEHHLAWCDELAKWPKAGAAWANLRLGMRLGERPRILVTTTPRSVDALKLILAAPGTLRSGGASRANPHQSEDNLAAVEQEHGGTRFGRQELEGLLIDDVERTLWPRDLIEASRVAAAAGLMRRIVVGVDPPASAGGDACGIVVCGQGEDGIAYVLADCSIAGASPAAWGRRVAQAADAWEADRVVAEANNGGDMVEAVLTGADAAMPVRLVHASRGKQARAEPVAARFESGKAKLAGRFPELEDELAGLQAGGGYEGPGRSPDRADAMVWAMTELIRPIKVPRITML